jgi:hypothetical protein
MRLSVDLEALADIHLQVFIRQTREAQITYLHEMVGREDIMANSVLVFRCLHQVTTHPAQILRLRRLRLLVR